MSKRTTSSCINSCERIRPERSRNTCIQRLVWSKNGSGGGGVGGSNRGRYQHGYDENFNDDIEVTNPRVALRRLAHDLIYFQHIKKDLLIYILLLFSCCKNYFINVHCNNQKLITKSVCSLW